MCRGRGRGRLLFTNKGGLFMLVARETVLDGGQLLHGASPPVTPDQGFTLDPASLAALPFVQPQLLCSCWEMVCWGWREKLPDGERCLPGPVCAAAGSSSQPRFFKYPHYPPAIRRAKSVEPRHSPALGKSTNRAPGGGHRMRRRHQIIFFDNGGI